MKKTLVSALTTAIVVGAASTTFAAANPFSDVPADSWAYDAVAQLAKDGVIDGYGDGTYRGDQQITRYEMAQMVARSMAKTDVSASDKAMIDKLAAEFADELGNLGVRVAALEKKVDNVKWYGEMRYYYKSAREDKKAKDNVQYMNLRLYADATVNENWTVKSRIEYKSDLNSSKNATGTSSAADGNGDVYLNRAYAEGVYGNTVIDLGKFPAYTTLDQGMVFDDQLSGAMAQFGKDVKVSVWGGRFNGDANNANSYKAGQSVEVVNYQAIEIDSNQAKKLTWGAAYHHVNGAQWNGHIWELGLGYKFTPTVAAHVAYARGSASDADSSSKKAYNVQVNYKGANAANKGSFGIFAAYRYLGAAATISPTYDEMGRDQKGWDLGFNYALQKNVVGTLAYFTGKEISTSNSNSTLFGQVEFFF
jgi:hypothetical protein